MENQKCTIRNVLHVDVSEITQIYNYYIANTIITFEEEAVSDDIIGERVNEIQLSKLPWFVAEQNGKILGYSYASKWKGRCAYRFSTEITVYISPDHVGKGIGFRLYSKLRNSLVPISPSVAVL